mgnify:CR=1 FL=1
MHCGAPILVSPHLQAACLSRLQIRHVRSFEEHNATEDIVSWS